MKNDGNKRHLYNLKNSLAEKEKEIIKLNQELIDIHNSKIWKLLYIYKNLKKIKVSSIKFIKYLLFKKKYHENKESPYFYKVINGNFTKNSVLGICHKDWKGIKNATTNQCSKIILVKNILNITHAKLITSQIEKLGYKKVSFNGLPDGIEILVSYLHKHKKNINTYLVWHGSFTQQTIELDHIYRLNKLTNELPKFKKIGFVKNEMANIFTENKYNASFLPNLSPKPINTINKKNIKKNIDIGILSQYLWHKNNMNQYLASINIDNSTTHVLNFPKIKYLSNKIKHTKIHGLLDKKKFNKLLGSMDINCYVSLTECYPMVFIESISKGIPCLIGKTSEYIVNKNPVLNSYLVVQNPESIFEIRQKINNLIINYNKISQMCLNFSKELYTKNKIDIFNFFNE